MGEQIYPWSGSLCLESERVEQVHSDQIILFILNSNIIVNDEIITYNSGSYRIFLFIKENIGVIF